MHTASRDASRPRTAARSGEDSMVFAGIFQLFYLRLAIFFGCLGIFSNLFRGEVLEKTLHYYFLAPVRREVLVAGKYLAGLIAAGTLFCFSVALAFFGIFAHFGQAFQDFFWRGPGLEQLVWYLVVTALGVRRLRRGVPHHGPDVPQSHDPRRRGAGLGGHQPLPARAPAKDQRDLLPEDPLPGGGAAARAAGAHRRGRRSPCRPGWRSPACCWSRSWCCSTPP